MEKQPRLIAERILIYRLYYAYVIVVFGIEGWLGHTISSLNRPAFISPEADNTYWLIHLTGFPQWIVSSCLTSVVFELIVLVIAFCCFLFPTKGRLPILFSLLLLMYTVTKNSYVGHHEHGLNGLMIMSFIFWPVTMKNFILLFRALRFYVLFIFISAAFWKIWRGSVFEVGQLSEVLKHQHLEYATSDQNEAWFSFITRLIDHPQISHFVLIAGVIVQSIFILGFFSKRFDHWLLIFFFLFFAVNGLLMRLPFYQIYPLALVFLPFRLIRFPLTELNKEIENSRSRTITG